MILYTWSKIKTGVNGLISSQITIDNPKGNINKIKHNLKKFVDRYVSLLDGHSLLLQILIVYNYFTELSILIGILFSY